MATITVNGVRLAYDEFGAGPPVVWVHGSWTDRRGADLLVPLLAGQHRMITYDRRGHSQSERPPGRQGVMTHVHDLAALIKQLDAAPAHLVTNSFGGEIALKLAVRHPALVASLCLHEPGLLGILPDDPEIKQMRDDFRTRCDRVIVALERGDGERAARWFLETVALGPGAWDALPEQRRRTFIHNAPTWLDQERDPTLGVIEIGQLAAITVPVLLTDGRRSDPVLSADLPRLADVLPNARRYTFANAGHLPHLTHPDELARVVSGFLDDLAAKASALPGS